MMNLFSNIYLFLFFSGMKLVRKHFDIINDNRRKLTNPFQSKNGKTYLKEPREIQIGLVDFVLDVPDKIIAPDDQMADEAGSFLDNPPPKMKALVEKEGETKVEIVDKTENALENIFKNISFFGKGGKIGSKIEEASVESANVIGKKIIPLKQNAESKKTQRENFFAGKSKMVSKVGGKMKSKLPSIDERLFCKGLKK